MSSPSYHDGLITFNVWLEMLEILSSDSYIFLFISVWRGKSQWLFWARLERIRMTGESFSHIWIVLLLCRFAATGERRERAIEQFSSTLQSIRVWNLKLTDRYGEDQHQRRRRRRFKFHCCSFSWRSWLSCIGCTIRCSLLFLIW